MGNSQKSGCDLGLRGYQLKSGEKKNFFEKRGGGQSLGKRKFVCGYYRNNNTGVPPVLIRMRGHQP